jgi:hypothetical protein
MLAGVGGFRSGVGLCVVEGVVDEIAVASDAGGEGDELREPTPNGPSSSATSNPARSPSASRSYDTPCTNEHSCLRCPPLRPDPGARARLEEIRGNLIARIAEAESHHWYGEVEGLKVSLAGAGAKRAQMEQISASRTNAVQLGIPSFTDTADGTVNPPGHRNQF